MDRMLDRFIDQWLRWEQQRVKWEQQRAIRRRERWRSRMYRNQRFGIW
jgi:hypothetical protein